MIAKKHFLPVRIIARLDVKGANLIKGIQLEGVRVIGDPYEHAKSYYEQGIDELLYVDAVASLYGRDSMLDLITKTAKGIFIPFTVGGGIRTVDDVKQILRAGADKIAINSAAIRRPNLISEVAQQFGSQCMVVMIEAKREGSAWQAYCDNGREPTGLDVIAWAKQAAELGAGEILLTSVDREGTRKGFDVALTKAVSAAVSIPVIASGGMGKLEHLTTVVEDGGADAVAMADVLHYQRLAVGAIKQSCKDNNIPVRPI